MSVPKVVVHTDLFLDHLMGDRRPSVLRLAMGKFFCYTTAFQAIELFSLARTERERTAIENSMAAMKILGLNSKSARRYGDLLSGNKKINVWDLLIAGLCLESRLPILTSRTNSFSGIKGLVVVPAKLIGSEKSADEVLRAVRP